MIKAKNTRKIIFAVVFVAALIGFGIFAKNAANKQIVQNNSSTSISKKPVSDVSDNSLSKVQKDDIVLGDENAPVTMIEYASLSCPHCASFYSEAFNEIKAEYIDSGKVKFIYRDFPLNQPALAAAMVALCSYKIHKDQNKYHDFIKALFKTQESWAFTPEFATRIAAIAKLDGMSNEEYEKCSKDTALQKQILEARIKAAKSLQIQSTPSFIINGELISGFGGTTEIKKIIDKKLHE